MFYDLPSIDEATRARPNIKKATIAVRQGIRRRARQPGQQVRVTIAATGAGTIERANPRARTFVRTAESSRVYDIPFITAARRAFASGRQLAPIAQNCVNECQYRNRRGIRPHDAWPE